MITSTINFELIKGKIVDELDENKGLFLGTGHQDEKFHKYLASELPKLNCIVFAEIDPEAFNSYIKSIASITTAIVDVDGNKKPINFDSINEMLKKMFNNDPSTSVAFLAFLLALHLSDIKIIPFDYVPKSDKDRLESERAGNILHGKYPNATLTDIQWATARRVSEDKAMAAQIKTQLLLIDQSKKYIVIGGPAHVTISEHLATKALNVMPMGLYKNMMHGSDPTVIEKLRSSNVTSYAYENDKISQVGWKGDDNLNTPKIQSGGNNFGKGFAGMFNSDVHSSAKSSLKNALKLKNTTKAELERGLRQAAFNNITNCLLELIKINVNLDATSESEGKTALHMAIVKNHHDSVKILLDHGARFDIPDKQGKTAKEYAENNHHLLYLFHKIEEVI